MGLSRFSAEIFLSHGAENFRKGIPQFFKKHFGFKKFDGWKGGYHVFPSNVFGLTWPKNLLGNPSMFQKLWGIEKFYA